VITEREPHARGGAVSAYIKTLPADEASRMFPTIEGLPKGINLFSLHAADGTPLALTDTRQAAIGHAIDDDLEIARVHLVHVARTLITLCTTTWGSGNAPEPFSFYGATPGSA